MPPNGGVIRPENVQVKPFFPKSKLNAKLSVRVFGLTMGSNGLPDGYTDLDRRHPGIKEDFTKGVLIVKVFSTSFRPDKIEDEASQDVEGLTGVNEATLVVREEARGVIFKLQDNFAEENERPGRRKVAVSFPFDLNPFVCFPSNLSLGAIEDAMLRGLFGARAAHFALRGNTHELEPGSNRKVLIKGEPDEGAHFFWAGVMPYSGNGLRGCGVPEVEATNERNHVRGA
ncbi:unnamed protein product [Sphagnum balticum]